jgi:hypothetical protein
MVFGNKQCPGIEDLFGVLRGLATEALLTNGLTDERGFFPHIASRPFRGCIYIAAGCQEPFLSLADGA